MKSDESDPVSESMLTRRYRLLALLYHDEENIGKGEYSTIVRKKVKKDKVDDKDAKIKKKSL